MLASYWLMQLFILTARPLVSPFPEYSGISNADIKAAVIDEMACTDENKTYTVDLKLHAEDIIVKAIHSVALSVINSHETETGSVEAYFGTIVDELNEYLIRFKVQIHLNLDGYNSDDFMGRPAFDMSCERSSPVIERTSSAFSHLKQSFNENIGIHLFVWGCPYFSSLFDLETVYTNLECGRVMGVMWRGTQETRALIKSSILNALTGSAHMYSADSNTYDSNIGPSLCKYVTQCIGMDKSEIGQFVYGTEVVKYTDVASEGDHSEESGYASTEGNAHTH